MVCQKVNAVTPSDVFLEDTRCIGPSIIFVRITWPSTSSLSKISRGSLATSSEIFRTQAKTVGTCRDCIGPLNSPDKVITAGDVPWLPEKALSTSSTKADSISNGCGSSPVPKILSNRFIFQVPLILLSHICFRPRLPQKDTWKLPLTN